jgi:uncharacterized Rossmann fold enzyme
MHEGEDHPDLIDTIMNLATINIKRNTEKELNIGRQKLKWARQLINKFFP